MEPRRAAGIQVRGCGIPPCHALREAALELGGKAKVLLLSEGPVSIRRVWRGPDGAPPVFSGESFTNRVTLCSGKCQVVPKGPWSRFLQFWGLPCEVSRGPDTMVSEITLSRAPIVNPSICKTVRCPFQVSLPGGQALPRIRAPYCWVMRQGKGALPIRGLETVETF